MLSGCHFLDYLYMIRANSCYQFTVHQRQQFISSTAVSVSQVNKINILSSCTEITFLTKRKDKEEFSPFRCSASHLKIHSFETTVDFSLTQQKPIKLEKSNLLARRHFLSNAPLLQK
jgi:hypothetical protein